MLMSSGGKTENHVGIMAHLSVSPWIINGLFMMVGVEAITKDVLSISGTEHLTSQKLGTSLILKYVTIP